MSARIDQDAVAAFLKIPEHRAEVVVKVAQTTVHLIALIAESIRCARREAFEECVLVALSEPELEGAMPEKAYVLAEQVGPEMNARIAVRLTKDNIARRIRALISKEGCSDEGGR